MAIPGASGNVPLSGLWAANPKQAIGLVTQAIHHCKGNITHTAKFLRVSRSTLNRWISLNIELRVELNKAQNRPGRPSKS